MGMCRLTAIMHLLQPMLKNTCIIFLVTGQNPENLPWPPRTHWQACGGRLQGKRRRWSYRLDFLWSSWKIENWRQTTKIVYRPTGVLMFKNFWGKFSILGTVHPSHDDKPDHDMSRQSDQEMWWVIKLKLIFLRSGSVNRARLNFLTPDVHNDGALEKGRDIEDTKEKGV